MIKTFSSVWQPGWNHTVPSESEVLTNKWTLRRIMLIRLSLLLPRWAWRSPGGRQSPHMVTLTAQWLQENFSAHTVSTNKSQDPFPRQKEQGDNLLIHLKTTPKHEITFSLTKKKKKKIDCSDQVPSKNVIQIKASRLKNTYVCVRKRKKLHTCDDEAFIVFKSFSKEARDNEFRVDKEPDLFLD